MSVRVDLKDIPIQIPIDINDSCNCWSVCCSRPKKVYITKKFVAKQFDLSSSVDVEGDRKASYARIQWLFQKFEAEAMIEASIVFRDNGEFLTTKDIHLINELLSEATQSDSALEDSLKD